MTFLSEEILRTRTTLFDNNITFVVKVQVRTCVKVQTIKELVQIVDTKVLGDILINLSSAKMFFITLIVEVCYLP